MKAARLHHVGKPRRIDLMPVPALRSAERLRQAGGGDA